MKTVLRRFISISCIGVYLFCSGIALAGDTQEAKTAWYENIDSEWGGHIRGGGSVSWHQQDSIYLLTGDNPFADAFLETRIKNKTFWTDHLYTDIHYELVVSGIDTRAAEQKLQRQVANFSSVLANTGEVNDDRRLFDLTDMILEHDHYILYHRLDRLSLSISPSWGLIRLGRQAVTWGNGFIFNPMDLFNPFAPSDIIRDYKMGDDMALFQTRLPQTGELQLVAVPRRNPLTGHVEWDSSSFGGKVHLSRDTYEFDFMAARHYEDYVFGTGITGYVGDAAWRSDATYTFLENPNSRQNGFFSIVANLDYSWVWGGKNVYGLLEIYYNGLGKKDYGSAIFEPEISTRVSRGELFTLGKPYLATRINIELHPLINAYVTTITNLRDPSGLIQPYAVIDLTQNLQLTLGANISWGNTGTEYGGFYIPGTNFLLETADSIYMWATYYF